MEISESEMTAAVMAVHAHRHAETVEQPQRPLSYFTIYDWWHYDPVYDAGLCDVCDHYALIGTYNGAILQSTFPYLEVTGPDTIKVNAHQPRDPNCRCVLRRA